MISLFECKRLFREGSIDAVVVVALDMSPFAKHVVSLLKLNRISRIGFINPFTKKMVRTVDDVIYWIDPDKGFLPYLETHIIDSCNLNCKACTHFAPLCTDDDFYDLEQFKRDIRRLSNVVDVITFRMLGGEPFKKRNVVDYIDIVKTYMPHTHMRFITNGLLIPTLPQEVLDSLKINKIALDITLYPPTAKIFDEIKSVLDRNEIIFSTDQVPLKEFFVYMNLHGGHDPSKSASLCRCAGSRFLRDGKIYKCPVDATTKYYNREFGGEGFPAPTSVDIYAENFVSLVNTLDGYVELCTYCNEEQRFIPWQASNKHVKEEWLY